MRCSAPLCNSSPALTCYIRRIQRSCRQRVQVCCPGRNTNNRKHNEDDDRGKVRRPVGRRVRVRVWVVSWLSLFFSQRLCCQHIPLSSSTAHLSLPPPAPTCLSVFSTSAKKRSLFCVCVFWLHVTSLTCAISAGETPFLVPRPFRVPSLSGSLSHHSACLSPFIVSLSVSVAEDSLRVPIRAWLCVSWPHLRVITEATVFPLNCAVSFAVPLFFFPF